MKPFSRAYLRIVALRTLGNFCILLALFLTIKTFWQPVQEEAIYWYNSAKGTRYALQEDVKGPEATKSLQELLQGQHIEVIRPIDTDFGLVIPKINANSNVIANVDPAQKKVYLEALKYGVAHAKGTALPGENGHIFMFAHSTDNFWNVNRYNAIFYLLYKLEPNDEVNLYYKGQRYKYLVTEKKVVSPRDVHYLTRKTPEESLTLQTCWPPGTTLQRMLVFAKPISK